MGKSKTHTRKRRVRRKTRRGRGKKKGNVRSTASLPYFLKVYHLLEKEF